jgi:hypothetical protein
MIYDVGHTYSSLEQAYTGCRDPPVNMVPILPYDRFNRVYQSDIDTTYYMQIQYMQF